MCSVGEELSKGEVGGDNARCPGWDSTHGVLDVDLGFAGVVKQMKDLFAFPAEEGEVIKYDARPRVEPFERVSVTDEAARASAGLGKTTGEFGLSVAALASKDKGGSGFPLAFDPIVIEEVAGKEGVIVLGERKLSDVGAYPIEIEDVVPWMGEGKEPLCGNGVSSTTRL